MVGVGIGVGARWFTGISRLRSRDDVGGWGSGVGSTIQPAVRGVEEEQRTPPR